MAFLQIYRHVCLFHSGYYCRAESAMNEARHMSHVHVDLFNPSVMHTQGSSINIVVDRVVKYHVVYFFLIFCICLTPKGTSYGLPLCSVIALCE